MKMTVGEKPTMMRLCVHYVSIIVIVMEIQLVLPRYAVEENYPMRNLAMVIRIMVPKSSFLAEKILRKYNK